MPEEAGFPLFGGRGPSLALLIKRTPTLEGKAMHGTSATTKTRIISSFLMMALLGACGSPSQKSSSPDPGSDINSPPRTDDITLPGETSTEVEPMPTPSPLIAESQGWREVIVTSDAAEIKFDPTGHWSISRNNCWVAGYGAMTLTEWNAFAGAMNALVRAERLPAEDTLCISQSSTNRSWKGPLEIVRDEGTKETLFTAEWPDRICTRLNSRSLALDLQSALNGILPRAFSEDCTNPAG
jgi:hypothetical protein